VRRDAGKGDRCKDNGRQKSEAELAEGSREKGIKPFNG